MTVHTCEYKCIVFVMQMVAKGKDVSHLFPFVVKNVVSKNQEVGGALHVCVCVCVSACASL